ncbi:MAG TPA: glycosyltransferase family 9 protein [Rhodocyclaceae bacterium]|nr:glycosyltransferase family 9 protein [Rhodocyclaceae bacterium]
MKSLRILVIIVARIGDTLLITPTLRAIKAHHPDAVVTVMAHPKRMEVLAHSPYVDHLVPMTPKTAFWRYRFSGRCFDQAIVFGHDASLVRLALRTSKEVVAFRQKDFSAHAALKEVAKPDSSQPMHAVHERLLLAGTLGIRAEDFRLAYSVSAAEKTWSNEWLARHVPAAAAPLIGIQPFSFPTKAHRDWPLSAFNELVGRLRTAYPDAHFLIFGDALARQKSGDLLQAHRAYMTVCAGDFSLRQTAVLMAHLDLYVGVDTGPTHLAGALGVPMVAMYHCAYPGRYLAPLDHPALRMIEHPQTGQTRSSDLSMADISVDQVFEAAMDLLSVRQA